LFSAKALIINGFLKIENVKRLFSSYLSILKTRCKNVPLIVDKGEQDCGIERGGLITAHQASVLSGCLSQSKL